ncbi:MAG TPA: Asp-tRNA(Asn)/Glu-tRNA(Gln) amidotransferase subunit GatA [Candidatus Limnocylindrales bacterium]|nr:Asp-tRNA(Asn)/Glu-tRNA(Gln) amidotransferase subunit GatA [Candidatus Limnocylindrales bacterium]
MELCDYTIHELHEMMKRREITSRQITESVLSRIDQVENRIRAYITVLREEALEQASIIDQKLQRGEIPLTPLTGIPIAIKDLICTRGVLTTCAAKILHNFIPPYDATVIARLKQQNIVMIGKTNLDQFGMGSSTENSYYGITRNPWDLSRVPGGSSGGSAAAVIAGEAIGALGTDTGGSIRQPSSFCSTTGLKPTYGRVSRYGLIAYASSLDQIGPIAKDVTDCAILLNALSGYDPKDSTSVNLPTPDYTRALVPDITGLKIGIPEEYFIAGMDEEVEEKIWEAVRVLEKLGASYEKVSLPHTEYAVAAYYIIAPAEASSNLARYDGVKYGYRADTYTDLMDMYMTTRSQGFSPEVKRRIMLGTYSLSSGYYDAYYLKAQKVRTLIKRDFEEAFKKYDVLVAPVSPTPAFKIGEKTEDPLQMYLSDIFTIPINLAGVTALSIPCGFTKDGLPIGLQIIGKHFGEETILKVAYAFEQNTEHHKKKPPL